MFENISLVKNKGFGLSHYENWKRLYLFLTLNKKNGEGKGAFFYLRTRRLKYIQKSITLCIFHCLSWYLTPNCFKSSEILFENILLFSLYIQYFHLSKNLEKYGFFITKTILTSWVESFSYSDVKIKQSFN